MKKAKVPRSSKWFAKDKTSLPFPEAGLKNSDAEDDDEDDEDEIEEVGGEQDNAPDPSVPVPEDVSDPSAPAPKDVPDPSALAPVGSAHQSEN